MISDMELEQIREHAEALTEAHSSDDVRLGRAILVLLEAHAELKQPHVQAAAAPVTRDDKLETMKRVAAALDAAWKASMAAAPGPTKLEALRQAVFDARTELWKVV